MSTKASRSKTEMAKPVRGPAVVGKPPHAPGSALVTGDIRPALPHELDESTGHVARAPDPVIKQAKRDLDVGLVDTDMRATPGLDAKRRAELVPGAGGKPLKR